MLAGSTSQHVQLVVMLMVQGHKLLWVQDCASG
jgi:hypothetical protein